MTLHYKTHSQSSLIKPATQCPRRYDRISLLTWPPTKQIERLRDLPKWSGSIKEVWPNSFFLIHSFSPGRGLQGAQLLTPSRLKKSTGKSILAGIQQQPRAEQQCGLELFENSQVIFFWFPVDVRHAHTHTQFPLSGQGAGPGHWDVVGTWLMSMLQFDLVTKLPTHHPHFNPLLPDPLYSVF